MFPFFLLNSLPIPGQLGAHLSEEDPQLPQRLLLGLQNPPQFHATQAALGRRHGSHGEELLLHTLLAAYLK